jgi:hypothetical protein
MKRAITTIILVLLAMSIWGQNKQDKAAAIAKQFSVIREADEIMLKNLPSTFQEYLELCGDIDTPLNDYPSFVEHLAHSQQIDHDLFIKKIVDISVGATPGVDHVNYLNSVTQELVENNLRQVVVCLNKKSLEENTQFWSFIFGGIEQRESVEYKDRIKNRLKKLTSYKFSGYDYFDTVDAGYERSARYIVHH